LCSQVYVNVHSSTHPGGEIRGQIEGVESFSSLVSTSSTLSPSTSTALPSSTTPAGFFSAFGVSELNPQFSAFNFKCWWTIVGNSITLTMFAATQGWVAVGFSTSGFMSFSDIYVGWVSGSSTTLLDTWSTGYFQPLPDSSQGGSASATGISGSQSAQGTIVQFTRLLSSSDVRDVSLTVGASVRLVWAYGSADGSGTTFAEHINSGFANVVLNNPTTTTTPSLTTSFGANSSVVPTTTAVITTATTTTSPLAQASASSKGVTVQWTVNRTANTIRFVAQWATTGWIALAVANEAKMYPADPIVAWVDDGDRSVRTIDTWSTDYNQPVADSLIGGTVGVFDVTGSQSSSSTTVSFSRNLTSTDAKDISISDRGMYLLIAYGSSDGFNNNFAKHEATSMFSVNFVRGINDGEVKESWLTPGIVLTLVCAGLLVCVCLVRLTMHLVTPSKPVDVGAATYKQRTSSMMQENPHHRLQDTDTTRETDLDGSSKEGRNGYLDVSASPSRDPSSASSLSQAASTFPTATKSPRKFASLRTGAGARFPFAWLSYSQTTVYLLYILLNLLSLFLVNNVNGRGIEKNFGHLAAGNLCVIIILATRNSIIKVATGVSFDRTIVFHRLVGYILFLCVSLHMVLTWAKWRTDGRSISETWSNHTYSLGFGAWCVLLFILVTSLAIVRRRSFELFMYSHFAFVAVIVLAVLHARAVLPYVIVAAVLYIIDKIFRAVWGLLPVRTVGVDVSDKRIVKLAFPKNDCARTNGLYRPGQFIFLNIPALSWTEWHPFSLASAPHSPNNEVYVRVLGDFTSRLHALATTQAQTGAPLRVRADGPYGGIHVDMQATPTLVLVAGGIGITPVLSIVRHIYQLPDLDVDDLDEATEAPLSIPVYDAQRALCAVVWTVRTMDDIVLFMPVFRAALNASLHSPQLPQLQLHVYLTKGSAGWVEDVYRAGDATGMFHNGRADFQKVFDHYVTRIMQHTQVFVCGPASLTNDVWEAATTCPRTEGQTVDVIRECFAL